MNQKFSTYLRHIALLNETASTSMMNSDDKSSNKSFNDSTFDLLMKYFNNLDEEQKKIYESSYTE
jgi:DNA-binding protein Fis